MIRTWTDDLETVEPIAIQRRWCLVTNDFVSSSQKMFLGYSDPWHIIIYNKNKEFRGDLTDMSVKTKSTVDLYSGFHNCFRNSWTAQTQWAYSEPWIPGNLYTTNLRDGPYPDEFNWNRVLYNEFLDTTNHLLGYNRVRCVQGWLYYIDSVCVQKISKACNRILTETCLSAKGGQLRSLGIHKKTSVAVLAEIQLRSPQKVFIFIIKKCIYRIKVSNKLLI